MQPPALTGLGEKQPVAIWARLAAAPPFLLVRIEVAEQRAAKEGALNLIKNRRANVSMSGYGMRDLGHNGTVELGVHARNARYDGWLKRGQIVAQGCDRALPVAEAGA